MRRTRIRRPNELVLLTTVQVHHELEQLLRTGLYGRTVEEAAEELLRLKLREIQAARTAR